MVNHKKISENPHIEIDKHLKIHNDILDIFLHVRLQIIFKINFFFLLKLPFNITIKGKLNRKIMQRGQK